MRLILTENDGTVLDTTYVTRPEFTYAQQNGIAARDVLNSLQPDKPMVDLDGGAEDFDLAADLPRERP